MADAKNKEASPREGEEFDPNLSRQHEFSSYAENTELPDDNPPPGQHVVQTRGYPTEATPTKTAGGDTKKGD